MQKTKTKTLGALCLLQCSSLPRTTLGNQSRFREEYWACRIGLKAEFFITATTAKVWGASPKASVVPARTSQTQKAVAGKEQGLLSSAWKGNNPGSPRDVVAGELGLGKIGTGADPPEAALSFPS